mmetsp:Transcript_44464/g.106055  ORF Transcript_44464/g.106055 Transcript_44464/m.106055 type:complete len:231 (-) Transcript_44464:3159-3851(-)
MLRSPACFCMSPGRTRHTRRWRCRVRSRGRTRRSAPRLLPARPRCTREGRSSRRCAWRQGASDALRHTPHTPNLPSGPCTYRVHTQCIRPRHLPSTQHCTCSQPRFRSPHRPRSLGCKPRNPTSRSSCTRATTCHSGTPLRRADPRTLSTPRSPGRTCRSRLGTPHTRTFRFRLRPQAARIQQRTGMLSRSQTRQAPRRWSGSRSRMPMRCSADTCLRDIPRTRPSQARV